MDTWFILVLAGAVRPAEVCSRHYVALHRGACSGVATSGAGEEAWPQVPRGVIEASANIVGKTGSEPYVSCLVSSSPAARGIAFLL
jgi:hypothetical protein